MKFQGDVRPLSNNPAYIGVEFGGVDTIDEAIAQAKAERDHGLAEQFVPRGMSRNRAALLQHLNLLLDYKVAQEDDDLLAQLADAPSPYSLAYAVGRGWLNGPAKLAMELDPSN